MKKCNILFVLLIISLLFSCKKEEEKKYDITLIITGNGIYHYQIGSEKMDGHCITGKTITGIAKIGDYVELEAVSDSLNNVISVELDSNPIVGGSNKISRGFGKQQVQFDFK